MMTLDERIDNIAKNRSAIFIARAAGKLSNEKFHDLIRRAQDSLIPGGLDINGVQRELETIRDALQKAIKRDALQIAIKNLPCGQKNVFKSAKDIEFKAIARYAIYKLKALKQK